jgi:hypothetical protein
MFRLKFSEVCGKMLIKQLHKLFISFIRKNGTQFSKLMKISWEGRIIYVSEMQITQISN